MKVAILILAAGSSNRMGTAKQLLTIGHTTLIGKSIETALQSNAKEVFCVLGANAEKIRKSITSYNVDIIINTNYNNGLSSSIIAGLDHIENLNFDAVLITLADQPRIDVNHLNVLIDSFNQNPSKISASDYQDNNGVPAIFPKTYFKQLKRLEGDKGAKNVLNSNNQNVIKVNCNTLLDIDTQQDYLDFLKSL
ncbi:nucleotidyltransferase family protein [Psychroserpens luteolus]|uniref:nucleotidyltransferase family protein n=1 Tax=Psychroserpens luteolus TaxID=2855840 RepID=UPI001E500E3B|nr:nucleotidyltransferase family protein [Psychroserpens luteolus]MCD2257745.1 nucleotidyltransferase family protein [Psychroserpens luteolus]